MMWGGETSKGDPNLLDDTIPLDVARGEMRSSTIHTRYHSNFDDCNDEVEPDETSALYSGTQVPGTATLEITCRGKSADLQGASRPKLGVMNSAGQSGKISCGYNSDGQQQTDRLTPVVSTLQPTEEPSGKSGGTQSYRLGEERPNKSRNGQPATI